MERNSGAVFAAAIPDATTAGLSFAKAAQPAATSVATNAAGDESSRDEVKLSDPLSDNTGAGGVTGSNGGAIAREVSEQGARDGKESKDESQTVFQGQSKAKTTGMPTATDIPVAGRSFAENHATGGPSNVVQPSSGSLSLNSSSLSSDLADKIRDLSDKKDTNGITLDIDPEGLGRVTLRIETHQQEVSAWISADNDQVKDTLMKNSPQLRQFLSDQGLTLGQFSVDVRQEKQNDRSSSGEEESASKRNTTERIKDRERAVTMGSVTASYSSGNNDQLLNVFA